MADEDEKERLDRELIELLNELRVAIPGVQILFAFLLTVPFSARFDTLDDGAVRVYFAAVLLTTLASLLLIAPSVHHRLQFRQGSKEQLLRVANVLAVAGSATLALAMGVVVYLIADVIYGSTDAQVAAGAVIAVAAGLWFVLPLTYRRKATPAPPAAGASDGIAGSVPKRTRAGSSAGRSR